MFEPTDDELKVKHERIAAYLAERNLGGLLLSGRHNFAWATGGRDNHVVTGTDNGVGHALFTIDGTRYLLCDNVEAVRLQNEEGLDAQGFKFITAPWYSFDLAGEVHKLLGVGGEVVAADSTVPGTVPAGDLSPLRRSLVDAEIARYRWLGQTAREALETTAQALEPGMTEFEVGAMLDHFLEDEGVTPFLTLVASDDRITQYRHPIPTGKPVEKYVMYVTCAAKWGLIACATRLVYFGTVPPDLARKHDACAQIDTVFNLSTVTGASVADIFGRAQSAYRDAGFGDEWMLHHQGGATGYAGRDYVAVPGSPETVQANQAFAWNPSITGTKIEDTILAAPEPGTAPEILTAASPAWPTRRVETPLGALDRPLILER